MRGEENRAAALAVLPHDALDLIGRRRVEADEGLVHDDKLRVVDQSGDNGQLLLHAVRIGRDGLRQIAGQVEQIRIFLDPRLAVLLRHAENISHEVQIFDAGQEFIQIRIVRDVR